MPTITVEEAQARLPELIERLTPGEEVLLTRNVRTVAQPADTPRAICGRGKLLEVSEDDEHLQGFEE